eukprot:229483_1
MKLLVHAKDVTADITGAISDYKSQNWQGFGQDIGKVLGLLVVPSANRLRSSPAEVAKEILTGVAMGIEGDIGDLQKCMPDVQSAYKDLSSFESELADGIKTKNTQEIIAAWKELAAAVAPLKAAASDCGLQTLVADITTIVKELEQPKGWLTVLKQEGMKLIVHAKDVTEDISGAISNYKSQNWQAFGQDIGKIL